MARFGQGTTWSDFCFRRMILDALLRKDSRWPRVEVRRSVRGSFNHGDADDGDLDKSGGSGGSNKWLDSGYILEPVSM